MTVRQQFWLKDWGPLFIALIVAISSPLWAMAIQSGQQDDDHRVIQEMAKEVKTLSIQVAELDGYVRAQKEQK